MFSPHDCYRKTTGLRIRPVPEMGCCLVYTPSDPNLYTLNSAAWLIFELCDGRRGDAIGVDVAAAVRDATGARIDEGALALAMENLIRQGLVERLPAGAVENENSGNSERGEST